MAQYIKDDSRIAHAWISRFSEITSVDGEKVTAELSVGRDEFVRSSTTSTIRTGLSAQTDANRVQGRLPVIDGDPNQYIVFRKICDTVLKNVKNLKSTAGSSELDDGWMTIAAEIEANVQDLYDLNWGDKDSLKRVVLKVQSQINNAIWDQRHVGFLEDVFVSLRNRYSISNITVREVADLVKSHNLPQFRGTLTASGVRN